MYLKQLILKGFKSFADRSVLTLEPGITAVVGPNGSGKSNISDAVLWVLGERNAKNLRGQVMEDVIFSGSSARKSVGVAEVMLVLDNSDGSLPVDYDEVSVARRMYRNGESEYLINGTVVRRMDVLDILHDTGLGTGTHSIISQGHLDSILQSKPEDRRALIEEAAGVLKHKQRKAKSYRKIEQMDQHLARVNDVMKELERQLGPLQRKAKRAQQYQDVFDQLEQVKLQLAVDDLRVLRRQWDALLETEQAQLAEVEQKRAVVATAEQEYEHIQESIRSESAGVAALAQKHSAAQSLVDRFDSLSLLLGEKERQATQRCAELSALLDENATKRKVAQQQRKEAADQLEQVQSKRTSAQAALDQAQADYDESHNKRLRIERDIADLSRNRNDAAREAEQNAKQLARVQEQLASAQGRAQAAEERLATISQHVETAQAAQLAAQNSLTQAQAEQQRLQDSEAESAQCHSQAQQEVSAAQEAADEAHADVQSLQAELRGIEEIQRAYMAGAGAAHEWVSKQAEASWGSLSPLYDHLKVQDGYEQLVEQLLGSDMTALLVQDKRSVSSIGAAVSQQRKQGRVTLMLPHEQAATPAAVPGCTPLLEKVSCDNSLAGSISVLLGDVMLCPSLDDALAHHLQDKAGLRFATQDGAVVFPSGKVVLGGGASQEQGTLSYANRAKACGKELKTAQSTLASCQQRLEAAKQAAQMAQAESLQVLQQLAHAKGQVQACTRSLQDAQAACQQAQSERETCQQQHLQAEAAVQQALPQVDQLKAKAAQLDQAVQQAKDKVSAKQKELDPARDAEQKLSQQLADAKVAFATLTERETFAARQVDQQARELVALSAADEASLTDLSRKQAARKRIQPLLDTVAALREGINARCVALADETQSAQDATLGSHAQANAAREASSAARASFDASNEALSNTRVEKGRLEMKVQAAADAIVHDCKTPMEQALRLPELERRQEVEDRAFKLQRRIANMGNINPDAAEEYQALKERYDYLQGQLEDLASARSALKKIDRVIDRRMKDDFINTFHTVDAYFQEIFGVLFPGGTAELTLVDPENLETTGVEVKAQPRGKRITKMTLMSGGEKSLVACALLFAVYRTRSTPFYILDEIEAALDDTNLRRLTSYLRELSERTQLILITHQRRTMEMADVLFGVSMQADGVTKVVSQRLEKALQYAE
ncbi:MAG: chromosome segregation protein SMC [Coriobacteriia bacterium]|nr:chromosome segregation protein SMC [Coriobacteriia bacterium]